MITEIQIKFRFTDTDYMTMDEYTNKKEREKMNNGNLALKLVEGTKVDRDQYINKVEVLDNIKELIMLPDNKYIESKNVAKYFNVHTELLRQVYHRNREEFESDGVKTITGLDLAQYKNKIALQGVTLNARRNLTLYTRRAVLRMGMLLTTSSIAVKIREYLLNVEQSTTQEQKQNALKFNGEWTKELDQYIFEKVEEGVKNGHSVKNLLTEIAKEVDSPETKIRTRWYAGNKELRPLRDRLDKNTKQLVAKGDHLKLVHPQNDEVNNVIRHQQELLLQVISELHSLKEVNDKLYKGMGTLWRGHKELNESFNELKNDFSKIKKEIFEHNQMVNETYIEKVSILENRLDVQAKKLKKEREELQKAKSIIADNVINNKKSIEPQSFKMDRNGNLTKIN
jgi:hypothetical protein